MFLNSYQTASFQQIKIENTLYDDLSSSNHKFSDPSDSTTLQTLSKQISSSENFKSSVKHPKLKNNNEYYKNLVEERECSFRNLQPNTTIIKENNNNNSSRLLQGTYTKVPISSDAQANFQIQTKIGKQSSILNLFYIEQTQNFKVKQEDQQFVQKYEIKFEKEKKSGKQVKQLKRHERNFYPYIGTHFIRSLRYDLNFQSKLRKILTIENPVWYVLEFANKHCLKTKCGIEQMIQGEDQHVNLAIKIWITTFLPESLDETSKSKNKNISKTSIKRKHAFLNRSIKVQEFIENYLYNKQSDSCC